MRKKVIELHGPADPDRILTVTRSVVEKKKYLWEQTDPTSATAYQGGKKIEKKSAPKLVLGVDLENGGLVLTQQTTGAATYLVNLGPLGQIQVDGQFRKMHRLIRDALHEAALAA